MKTLPPGSTIGILGGGQLGRMTVLAAAKLGYNCHVFCPNESEPAVAVAAAHTKAEFTDEAALQKFASQVDVVTLEWENVPLLALEILERYVAVHPSSNVLRVSQDREREKAFARSIGIGTAEYTIVHSAAELDQSLKQFRRPVILKSTSMGYDGKGQVKITSEMTADTAWHAMGGPVGILESFVDFACEISVIVACREDGASATYPAVENIHRNHILAETHAPAGIDNAIAAEAEHLARLMAEKLEVVGLLAVEMFVLKQPNKNGQRVLMNEIAPRPHNSGHWTMDGCTCNQFEQLVRAVCGLPLGSTSPHSRIVMYNLIGEDGHNWAKFLQDPQASLHMYGKKGARAGRKMGHVNCLKGTW